MQIAPKEIDAFGEMPTEYEIAVAQLRYALTTMPPDAIIVAGQGVVTGDKYLATGEAGIWLSNQWCQLLGSTNLATLMKTGWKA